MAITFTAEEVKQLTEKICNSDAKRSFSSHKKDVKKFILAYFEKQGTSVEKVTSKDKKTKAEKSSENKNETSDGYKIIEVSNNLEFPTSVYKKDTPILAANSAMKAIIKKNKLESTNSKFTFSIKKDNRTFRYTCNGENLSAHHGRQ